MPGDGKTRVPTEARERTERQEDLIARMQRQIEALQSLTLPQAEATPNSCKKQAEATPNSCKQSWQFRSVRDEFWRRGTAPDLVLSKETLACLDSGFHTSSF